MSILIILATGPFRGKKALITCEECAWRYLSTLTDSEDLLLVTHGWGVWICGSLDLSLIVNCWRFTTPNLNNRRRGQLRTQQVRGSGFTVLHLSTTCEAGEVKMLKCFPSTQPSQDLPFTLLTHPSTWLAPHSLQAKFWAGADLMSWPSLKIMPWTFEQPLCYSGV